MLKKSQRIANVGNIRGTRTISSPFLIVKYLQKEEGLTKFAFVISKKVDKRAVIRNKIKRGLAKAVQEVLDKIKTDYNVIIIAKPSILEKDNKQQAEILKEIFTKANLFK